MIKKCSVTCVITMHREGLLAHTTLNSIAKARENAEAEGFPVAFVITLDNPDALTERIVRKHPSIRESDLMENVHFGDLGLCRNYAVGKASCDYIVCMDGDDYYSSNYIAAMVHKAMKGKNIVVCPEYLVLFGTQYHWTRFGGPEDCIKNSYVLFSEHHYCATVAAHKDVFARLPFTPCKDGFGYEDWHWNLEARAAGMEHQVARDVVLFYRRKAVSLSKMQTRASSVVPPSRFFETLPKPESEGLSALPSPQGVPNAAFPWKEALKSMVFSILRLMPASVGGRVYAVLRNGKVYAKESVLALLKRIPGSMEKRIRPLLTRIWRAGTKPAANGLEPVLYNALLEVARTDDLLHPDRLPPLPYVPRSGDEAPGRAYAGAWHALPRHDYDVVYTAPHITFGGADQMAINYIKVMLAEGKRVLFITSAGLPNRFELLPPRVDVLDLGALIRFLPHEGRVAVFTRLLLQLAPSLVHMVNDHFGFQCLVRHGQALRRHSKLFVSIFADAQDRNDYYAGAGTDYLRDLYPIIERVITDNAVGSQKWNERFGIEPEFFQPVYAKSSGVIRPWNPPSMRNRVLWAGRLDAEKRLDIACAIAGQLPEMRFDFYGRAILNTANPAVDELKTLPNVTFFGEHAGFSTLPAERYFAFLYTTQCDGLPIVLLEATEAGLPVVAPDRGGVRDFLTDETGWLVDSHEDVPAYVQALQEVRDNAAEAERRWKNACALLAARHNGRAFAASLLQAYTGEKEV
ncbi:MAG: glycosyltransferase [Desulfovibrio sp.]|nr:glycosyltransferase [Desulfovibrio sp.]